MQIAAREDTARKPRLTRAGGAAILPAATRRKDGLVMVAPHRIYVDLDDVLCQTALGLTEILEREFGKRVAVEDIRHFNLAQSFRISEDEVNRLIDIAHTPDELTRFRPVSDAVSALRAWRNAGAEVTVVTGRPTQTRDASRAWLDANGVPYDGLYFLDKYARFTSHEPEADDYLTMDDLPGFGFRLAVEDSLDMAARLAAFLPVPVVLMDRPWNRDTARIDSRHGRRLTRCAGWPEIVARFPPQES
jgi:uncharacterized protein